MELSSESTGVVFDFEDAAIAGSEMPDGLEPDDQLLFLELRALYDQRKKGLISRAEGVSEKRRIVSAYSRRKRAGEFGRLCRRQSVVLWRSVEHAASTYAKSRTLENADALYRAVYGVEAPKGADPHV